MSKEDPAPEDKKYLDKFLNIAKYVLVDGIVLFLAISLFLFAKKDSNDVIAPEDIEMDKQTAIDERLSAMSGTLDAPSVVIDPYGASPLSAAVIFDTDAPVAISANIVGQNGAEDLILDFPAETHHVIELVGLYAGNNEVHISGGGHESILDILTNDGDAVFECGDPWRISYEDEWSHAHLCDEAGNLRWFSTRASRGAVIQLANGLILSSTDQKLTDENLASGLYLQDFAGKIYKEYRIAGGFFNGLAEAPDGNIIAGGSEAGNKGRSYDYISIINRESGDTEKVISLDDMFPNKITWTNGFSYKDWFHISDIAFDGPQNSILVAGKIGATVLSIDYYSGKINYALGAYSSQDDIGLHDENGWYAELNEPTSLFMDEDVLAVRELNEDLEEVYVGYVQYDGFFYTTDIERSYIPVTISGISLGMHEELNKVVGTQNLIIASESNKAIVDAHKIDDEYRSKNIFFSHQNDRLCVLGDFEGTGLSKYEIADEIEIILSQKFKNYIYKLDNTVSANYLSIDGLNGSYDVYVRLNGKLYDAERSISF